MDNKRNKMIEYEKVSERFMEDERIFIPYNAIGIHIKYVNYIINSLPEQYLEILYLKPMNVEFEIGDIVEVSEEYETLFPRSHKAGTLCEIIDFLGFPSFDSAILCIGGVEGKHVIEKKYLRHPKQEIQTGN